MDVQTISTAIATSLATLGIRVYDYAADSPHSPAAYIYPLAIPYNAATGSEESPQFVVRLIVASVADKGGQAQLNALISSTGAGSAVLKIQTDNTLGGAVQSIEVQQMRNYGVLTFPNQATRYFSAELVCEVFA